MYSPRTSFGIITYSHSQHQEIILHTLYENGADIEILENYIRDDVDRLGTRLNTINSRMKTHLADLLVGPFAHPFELFPTDSCLASSTCGLGRRRCQLCRWQRTVCGRRLCRGYRGRLFRFQGAWARQRVFVVESVSATASVAGQNAQCIPAKQSYVCSIFYFFRGLSNIPSRSTATAAEGHKPPPPFEPVTPDILKSQVGLVQSFFREKLHSANNEPLVEDEDLPPKQRPPKPRLPPTGKILTPRKRPLHGQGSGSKKKKKVSAVGAGKKDMAVGGQLMERAGSKISDDGGMMSPESLVAGA